MNHFQIEDKFDGYRCITFINDDGAVEMFSRNGNPLYGYDDILHEMSYLQKGFIYDGELISKTFKGTQKTGFAKTTGKQAEYHIFDCLPIKDFVNMTGGEPLYKRLEMLKTIYADFEYFECVKLVVPIYVCSNDTRLRVPVKYIKDKVDECFRDAVSRGLEGIIIKDLDSLYMVGKSYSSACTSSKYYAWQKKKPRDLLDLTVVDVFEGTGKYEGLLGGVTVEYNGSDNKIHLVNVGSGFNDRDRKHFWNNKNKILGKTVKVATDGESSNEQGGLSLRFPIYRGLQSDR